MLHELLPDIPPVLIQKDVAATLGVSVRTLNNWLRQGYGPQPRRVGPALLYDQAAVEAFTRGVR